jgi:hypothetical protein
MKTIIILLVFSIITGCAVNPVTGDREFIIMSPSDDLNIGTQNYQPMVQAPPPV